MEEYEYVKIWFSEGEAHVKPLTARQAQKEIEQELRDSKSLECFIGADQLPAASYELSGILLIKGKVVVPEATQTVAAARLP